MMRPYTIEDIKQFPVDMMKTLDHAYIIVDALDECITNHSSVLELLHDLNDFENDNVKTFSSEEMKWRFSTRFTTTPGSPSLLVAIKYACMLMASLLGEWKWGVYVSET